MKINIAKCLLELLLESGKVTVPGLGEFVMNSQSASFGAGRKSLLPPTKSFSFNEDHNASDDALAGYLTQVVDINEKQAKQFVDKFSASVNEGLDAKKPVELAYVGLLKKQDGKIDFLQNSMTIAKINNLLPEVNLPEPRAIGETPKMEVPVPEQAPTKATSPSKPKTVAEPAKIKASKPATSKPVAPAAAAIKPNLEKPKERGCWPWVLAALLLIGALSVLGIKMCSSDGKDVYHTTKDPVATEEGVSTTDEGSTTSIDSENTKETNTSSSNSEETATTSIATNMPEDCIVIVASLQNRRNIARLVDKVSNLNYQLYTETHGAYTRVGVQIKCASLDGFYEDFISKVSDDFGVNAWSLQPEFPR